jgi:hypothetical protein
MKKLFLLLSLAVVVTSCWTHDGPPKTNGPAPEPHSGIFVCGIDTLFFNGDGETIRWSFSEQPDSLAPKGTGRYWFLTSGKIYRYDAADELLINDGVKSLRMSLYPGRITEDSITLVGTPGQKKIFAKVKE